jgi:predicted enzyme related to lactoylglutathione lyase
MPERDGYPAGVPCWIDTSQPDPDAAVTFYRDLFGWDFEDVMPEGSEGAYFIGRIRGGDVAAVAGLPENAPPMATWNTYIQVDSVDEAASRVNEAGGRIIAEPMDVMDAGRMAVAADPEGAVFSLWEPRRHRGARVVNEHGSLNFNTLSTRSPDEAKAFYGAVFGWGPLTLGGGAEMWTLPGYGDHLEELNPGMREGMAEMGAPKGFEDVVAALMPIADDQPHEPAHWSVTFAVDDAVETAAKARELGGEVVVEPFDAPWVRLAVLKDPQGATFIAGQFVAENAVAEG